MHECIDLKALFGDRYHISHDEAAASPAERRDPWLMTLPCRLGTIYPYGGEQMALEIDYHSDVAQRLIRQGLLIHQLGENQATLIFHIDDFERVAAVVQPRKNRQLSPERREQLRKQGIKPHVKTRSTARQGVAAASDDPRVG